MRTFPRLLLQALTVILPSKTGVRVDATLRGVNESGNVVLENVYVAGRNLSGYDFCFEHSGNGVALASAYKAAKA